MSRSSKKGPYVDERLLKRIEAQKEIAGLQVGAKVATDKANLSAKQQEAGLRLGVEIAREASQMAQPQPVSEKPVPKED